MKRCDSLEKWGLAGLKINLGFLEGEFAPRDPDRAAAGDLYIELLTRVATQYLPRATMPKPSPTWRGSRN